MKSIIISSVLSLMLTGNSPVRFAYPHNIISTPYGTCTWFYSLGDLSDSNIGSIFQGMTFGSDINMTVVNYTFNGQATGTFDLPVYDSVLSNYDLFVQGGMLISVPDTDGNNSPDALRFRVKDTKQFTCIIVHKNWTQPAVIGLSLLNQNITIGDTIESDVEEIVSYTSSIDGYTQTINSNVNTIKNILTQSLGSYVSQDGSLYTDIKSLITAFNMTNANLDALVKYDNIKLYMYSAYKTFSNIGDYQQFYFNGMTLNGILPAIRMIDASDFVYNSNNVIEIKPYTTFHVIGYFNTNAGIKRVKIVRNNGQEIQFNHNVLQNLADMFLVDYYYYNNSSSSIWCNIAPNTSGYRVSVIPLYMGDNVPSELGTLFNIDFVDTYTKKLDDVVNAIRNMAVNVNNLTVNATGITYNTNQTQVDNSVNIYQNNISIVNNIENNFKTMFDNANQNYNVDNIPITSEMINTNNFMNNIATQLYGIDIIKYPVTLLLLGIVLIGLLG